MPQAGPDLPDHYDAAAWELAQSFAARACDNVSASPDSACSAASLVHSLWMRASYLGARPAQM